MSLISTGLRTLAGGMRRGNSALAGAGAALVAVGWLKRTARPKRELLYAKTLRRGQGVRIRMLGADDEIEVSG